MATIIQGDCGEWLRGESLQRQGLVAKFALTFFDPPFNQGKDYDYFDDDLPEAEYWEWMKIICAQVRDLTLDGGSVYFMQREKNAENVLRCLRESGWTLQNLVVWAKRTSAVPNTIRFGKQYQIIAFATNGKRPRVFNRLRIDLPLRPEHKMPRENGVFVTDIWDDIREMTAGYFAGDEALRLPNGERAHKQQSPIALLLRILLSSTLPGDVILDPFAGTGTTLIVADQIARDSVGIEIDPTNVSLIKQRLEAGRKADSVAQWRKYYSYTPDLDKVWPGQASIRSPKSLQPQLLDAREEYGNGDR